MSENDKKSNNEIITFDTENINVPVNPKKAEINIDEILEKENQLLKQNKKLGFRREISKKYEDKSNNIEKTIPLDEGKEESNPQISQDMRDASRRIYLNKRVNQQLELFERRMIDEYTIFKDIKLTKEEINNNRLNNKIYSLIKKNYNDNNKRDNVKDTNSKRNKKEEAENVDLVQRYTFNREEAEYNRKKFRDRKTKRDISNDFVETSESLWEKEQNRKSN